VGGGAWGNRVFAASVGAFYDWAMHNELVGSGYLRLIVGDRRQGLLGAMDAVAEMPDGTSILDVPCGGGITLGKLLPGQRVRYVATDISPAMLHRARRQVRSQSVATVEFVECDITAMPFDDNAFDLIVCFSGLHCLPDPAAAVSEMARCLRPGGRLIADVALHGQLRRTDAFMSVGRAAGIFGPPALLADVRRWFCDAGLTINITREAGALVYIEAHR